MLNTRVPTRNAPKTQGAGVERVDGEVLDVDIVLSLHQLLGWTQLANCKGKIRLFFAPKAERPEARVRRETKAQKLCRQCPVQQPCKEFARDHHEYGFWGGESEEERHLAGYTIVAPIGIRARHHRAEQSH